MREDLGQLSAAVHHGGAAVRGLPWSGCGPLIDAARHADERAPEEACGVVVRGEFVPLENVAEDPCVSFKLDANEWDGVRARAQAVVHSHPGDDGKAYPSELDMHVQIATGLPWIILHRDGPFCWGCDERAPLLGRGFRYGTQDCYALIRDYYATEWGVRLPDFARSWDWWHNGQSLYEANFEAAGFEVVGCGAGAVELARPADVLLFRLRSPVPNHGAIYLGRGQMLHHVAGREPVDPTRLSAREPVHRWGRFLDKVVRYAAH